MKLEYELAKGKAKKDAKEKPIEVTLWNAANKLRGSVEPASYHSILEYIITNPINWTSDKFYQLNTREEL